MNLSFVSRWPAVVLAFCTISVNVAAQQPPERGPSVQAGADVPFIATSQGLVEKMLDMAKVTPEDYVIDLGSGDGRIVIAAARRGARARGVEFDAGLVEVSRRKAQEAGVGDRAEFAREDLFRTDLSRATVITLYLGTDVNLRLRPRLLGLTPGTRIVSNTYAMDDWIPDDIAKVDGKGGCDTAACSAGLWIVPAKIAGVHATSQGELALEQRFQMLSGKLRKDGTSVPVEGRVLGREVFLSAGGRQLHGRIDGTRLVLDP